MAGSIIDIRHDHRSVVDGAVIDQVAGYIAIKDDQVDWENGVTGYTIKLKDGRSILITGKNLQWEVT